MAKETKQEKHQRKWLENRDNEEEEEETKMAKQENKQRQELSESKIEQLNKQPIIETSIKKSENGMFVIHRTIITDIRPTKYYEKVLERM
ncbi:MAG: hypothetical protein Q8O89_08930 [Nanoarchaeota archaeon]|nr:hypothetical protein [Nanoarchaeota archaeon]